MIQVRKTAKVARWTLVLILSSCSGSFGKNRHQSVFPNGCSRKTAARMSCSRPVRQDFLRSLENASAYQSCIRIGIPELHPHLLRHSSASIAITNGADIASTSARLGHGKPDVTMRMYVHANDESIRKVGDTNRNAIKQARTKAEAQNE